MAKKKKKITLEMELRDAYEGQSSRRPLTFYRWIREMARNNRGTLQQAAKDWLVQQQGLKEQMCWTEAYRPFLLGHPYTPIKAYLLCTGPYDLGKGFQGFIATSPWNEDFVAESYTGAFVGPSLEAVRADVEAAEPDVIGSQLTEGLKRRGKATLQSAQEFWEGFSKFQKKEES